LLSEEGKEKAVKQFKLQLNGALDAFNIYGLGTHIPDVIETITELALLLHKRLDGKDIPITLEMANGKLRRRYVR